MRLNYRLLISAVFAVTAVSVVSAQEPCAIETCLTENTHYRLVDVGTFGGPNAHMTIGAHILNNSGTFTGYADTVVPDPYAPDGCWDGDCLVAHVARWKHGQLTDLGSLDTGPSGESNWISENGLIAGDSQNGLTDPLVGAWQIRGALWKRGKVFEVGTLGEGYNSLARAVNNAGEVVGLSTTTVPDAQAMILDFGLPYAYQTRAYRWKDGVIQDLGTLGGPDAMALGINERGQIVGNSYTSLDPSPVCGLTTGAFLWQAGAMINLGSLGGTCTQVSAINNRGQVIGNSSLPGDNAFHPFLWEQGKIRDLGVKGGNLASPLVMNDAGDAAGWASLPGDDNMIHATLWTGNRVIDLGSLGPGQCSIAFGINSRKQVVGLSGNCDFDDPSLRAFIWEPGKSMVDLNALIAPGLGVQLRNVADINDRGEMAAVGWFDDDTHRPVLLFPCGKGHEDCAAVDSSVHQANRSLVTPALRSKYMIMNAYFGPALSRRLLKNHCQSTADA